MQTAIDYDRIRDRIDNQALDRKFGAPVLSRDEIAEQSERAEQLRAEQAAKDKAERIDCALSEVLDVERCYIGGSLDYEAAAGVLTEYIAEIKAALQLLQNQPQRDQELAALRHENIQLNFAVTLYRAAKGATCSI